MKNRYFSFGLVMLLSVASAFAQGGTTGPLTWNISDSTLTISGNGAMPDYSPYDVNEYAPWYEYRTSIKTVVIEDGITSIGFYAFYYCIRMTSIIIPNSVVIIGNRAFDFCASLPSITIPNSVTYIGGGAFTYCRDLVSVDIPNSVTSIGDLAFYFCTSLSSITIPNSVESLGYQAFYFCTSLTSITLSGNITSIESGTFFYCTSLTSIIIPNSVRRIDYEAFSHCPHLSSVTLPDNLENIGWCAFYFCFNLTSVTNYNPVPTYIDPSVFHGVLKGDCTLKVPMNSVTNYKNAEEWKKFNIVGIEETGIVEADNRLSLHVFPNPTSGELRVTSYELQVTSIEVYDVMGRMVPPLNPPEGGKLPSFGGVGGGNISHLPNGVYFVRIQTEKGTVTRKVVKN